MKTPRPQTSRANRHLPKAPNAPEALLWGLLPRMPWEAAGQPSHLTPLLALPTQPLAQAMRHLLHPAALHGPIGPSRQAPTRAAPLPQPPASQVGSTQAHYGAWSTHGHPHAQK